uniref:GLOBIN domain-containing protein n=1 Tax=Magallana gigas TaxID=29159 RepID=A0A8W8HVP0_MAGGI
MGNTNTVADTKKDTLAAHLSTRQRLLVQDTLELMKDDLSDLGIIVFKRFFETEPSVKKVFPKIVKINDSNELELDMDMEVLSRHASNVMHSLGAAVESLDHSEFFNGIVENIGRSHGQRKIKPKMLEVLRDTYTKEVAAAWKKVYFYLCKHMRQGIQEYHAQDKQAIK